MTPITPAAWAVLDAWDDWTDAVWDARAERERRAADMRKQIEETGRYSVTPRQAAFRRLIGALADLDMQAGLNPGIQPRGAK